ncbi:MAG: sulfate adenylyltransferase subunit CysN [Robiginitomaculum sp.]
MPHRDPLIKQDVISYLKAQEKKSLLRFITCGSVDDGKSTLIGRMLYDSKLIYEDQLRNLETASKKSGTTEDKIDFALLVDGLSAEREQGITIDVAYRFFSTNKRKFIVADSPGHEQYTRNMATAASTADLAILLVDARHGIQKQTRRHSYITSLLGVKSIVVAINKMDLVNYSENAYISIKEKFSSFSQKLGFEETCFIPISALKGDNIKERRAHMSWYKGPTLISHLENVNTVQNNNNKCLRLPIQLVSRPNLDFRGFAGTIASGQLSVDDEIIAIPSGQRTRIKNIVTMDGNMNTACQDQAVTVTFQNEIDISRGEVICNFNNPAQKTDQFQAHILWMSDKKMFPGRSYLLKTINKTVPASITELKHIVNVNDLSKTAGKTLALNEIGVCNLSLNEPIAIDPYSDQRQTGCFVLIDRQTNATVGMGVINFSLHRASNIVWQKLEIGKAERSEQKNQRPAILWFTGLSGSGKSTIANLVEQKLYDRGHHTYILDGDNLRHGLCKDLGFTDVDRIENIRRVSETAKLMADAGLIVITSFISPFRAERNNARRIMNDNEFVEIYINTPLEVVEKRDTKGLYAKARKGEIKNFTGIDSEYQPPTNPDITIDTITTSADSAAENIIAILAKKNYFNP